MDELKEAQRRLCYMCGSYLRISMFSENPGSYDGFDFLCKSCIVSLGPEDIPGYYHLASRGCIDAIAEFSAAIRKREWAEWYRATKQTQKERLREYVADLHNTYVKRGIMATACIRATGILTSDITPEMIEAKREQLKALRLYRKIRREVLG